MGCNLNWVNDEIFWNLFQFIAFGFWLLAFGFEKGIDFLQIVDFFLEGGDFGGEGFVGGG